MPEQGPKRRPSGLLEKNLFVSLLRVKHFNKLSLDQTNNYLGGTELDGQNEKKRESDSQ